MLEPARRRVADAGLDNVEFLQADVQVHMFGEGSFDAVTSRFGMMFFEDPQAAFANLACAIRPGGRLVFVCWQHPLKLRANGSRRRSAHSSPCSGASRIWAPRGLPARSRSMTVTGSRGYSPHVVSMRSRWNP